MPFCVMRHKTSCPSGVASSNSNRTDPQIQRNIANRLYLTSAGNGVSVGILEVRYIAPAEYLSMSVQPCIWVHLFTELTILESWRSWY